ncbi:hypothetical protein Dimus_033432 [Dionaea muscipula]
MDCNSSQHYGTFTYANWKKGTSPTSIPPTLQNPPSLSHLSTSIFHHSIQSFTLIDSHSCSSSPQPALYLR